VRPEFGFGGRRYLLYSDSGRVHVIAIRDFQCVYRASKTASNTRQHSARRHKLRDVSNIQAFHCFAHQRNANIQYIHPPQKNRQIRWTYLYRPSIRQERRSSFSCRQSGSDCGQRLSATRTERGAGPPTSDQRRWASGICVRHKRIEAFRRTEPALPMSTISVHEQQDHRFVKKRAGGVDRWVRGEENAKRPRSSPDRAGPLIPESCTRLTSESARSGDRRA
jgi:hypothetical protein